MAKSNYENQKLNAFHIQAYFISIIRKNYLSRDDKEVIEELLKNIERSSDFRAKEIASVMKGEYFYYVKNDASNAIITLRECLGKNKSKHYPKKALNDIYKRKDMIRVANELNFKHNDEEETFDN